MGRLILISGPNDSGKSRFAESLLRDRAGDKFYIATMIPQTEDNVRRIMKHRRQREGQRFQTLEHPGPVGGAAVTPDSAVLLEDVSNLLGNAMFTRGADEKAVFADILALSERCALLVPVTISGLVPDGYDGETADYIAALNRLNERLFDVSDAAAELHAGVPVWRKGRFPG